MKRTTVAIAMAFLLACGFIINAQCLPPKAKAQSANSTEAWVLQDSHTKAHLRGVSAANSGTAWAVGATGTILNTQNEGQTWSNQTSGTDNNLNGIDCWDYEHAWAVGDGGTVRFTTDGATWQSGQCNMGNNLTGLSMVDEKTGWSSGLPTVSHPFSSMWKTTDGKEFRDQGWWLTRSLRDVAAWDSAHAVTVGDGHITCTTLDGGSWGGVHNIDESDWQAVAVVPGTKKAVAVGTNGKIAVCDNYGASDSDWSLKASGFSSTLRGVTAVNDSAMWTVGDYGIVLKSTDGGATWTQQPPATAENLYDVCAVDEHHAWAVGDFGTILYAYPPPTITSCKPGQVQQGSSAMLDISGVNTHFKDGESWAQFYPDDGIHVISTSVTSTTEANVQITVDDNAYPIARNVNVITGAETPAALSGGLQVIERPQNPPHLDGISPPQGPTGTFVTLTGSAFGASISSSSVLFNHNAVATEFRSWSDGSITCRVPSYAVSGPVVVTTTRGTSNPMTFTVAPPPGPAITDCKPKDVVQGHSAQVDIVGVGTNFINGLSKATFSGDGITVNLTSVSDPTHATAFIQVDSSASPGFRDVNVITRGQTPQPLANVFLVHQAPTAPPVLKDIQPNSGMVGTTVTLSGQYFGAAQGSSQVLFNGKPANHFVPWSDNLIVCSVPFGASTGMVEVVAPWGTSNDLHFEVTDFTFYFAEGTTRPNFDTYLTIQNPDDDQARVTITYMLGDRETKNQELTINAHTRLTVAASDVLGVGDDMAHDFSATVDCTNDQEIIVERPMYFNYQGNRHFNWTGGHDAVGALSPGQTFFFAEGTCRPGFDPYICIQNPGNADASTKITYMLGNGQTKEQDITVFKNSRLTLPVKGVLGEGDDAAHDFSAKVECGIGQQIVVERPMYFNYQGASALNWNGGHDVVGIAQPAGTFYFAEGSCRPDFEPYICVQNPGKAYADVKITYTTGLGGQIEQLVSVAPNSRSTIAVKDVLGVGNDSAHDFSAKVESLNAQEIVAERPMYFNYNGVWNDGSDVIGALAPASTFYFAEGTCRPNFSPYITIFNPELTRVDVKITYMLGNGQVKEQLLSIPPLTRSTVAVSDVLGTADDVAHDFSAKVECTNQRTIVAERPMYFNYNGVWNGGSDAMGFHAD